MTIEEEVFIKSKVDLNKLINYGFIKENNYYKYIKNIMNNKFLVEIIYDDNITGKIYEISTNEEYTNYRIKDLIGEFVSTIREEYINILKDIKDNCFVNTYFISDQANRITNEIIKLYNDKPDFPWQDNNGVFRNNDKWYALIMNVNKNKLGFKEDKLVDILNIKLDEKIIETLIKKKGFIKAYHMNKKSWISIILDDTLKDNEILELIIESHKYTEIVSDWIIPSSNNYGFDIIEYFKHNKTILWHQSNSINKNDIVYIYAGKPYSAILYKAKAIEVNIPNTYGYNKYKYLMNLEIIKEYDKDLLTFDILKKYGVTSIRGPRRITENLKKYIDEL